MKRREFVNKTGLVAVGIGVIPLISCNDTSSKTTKSADTVSNFELPDLPYAFDALAPAVDARTMEIHHDKHHAGYVRKLNNALQDHRLAGKNLSEMMASLKNDDSDTGVRNNGGGHFNHSMFWEIMKPGGAEMNEPMLNEIISTFGSKEDFEKQFASSAKSQFGSGWGWLCVGEDKKLFITSTPNQDNPLMKNIVEKPGTPIMGIDVWEHAYYLNYQNKRGDYISNWMNIVNWDVVSANYNKAIS
jgi:Fe-Mn family superoxide dismutase